MSRHHNQRVQRAERRRLAPVVAAGDAVCWRCELPILPGQSWDAGHPVALALGGSATGTLPEHARRADCTAGGNRSDGARLGNQLRARPRRRLDAWLAGFFIGPNSTEPRAVSVSPPRSPNIWTVTPQILRRPRLISAGGV